MPTNLPTIVTRLEASLEATNNSLAQTNQNVSSLADSVHKLGQEFRDELRGLAREFSNSRRPDWHLLLSAAALTIVLFAAGLTPLWMAIGYVRDTVAETRDWQTAYGRGLIPSAAEPKLAKLDEHQVEIETQFRGFRDQMGTAERYTHERADANREEIVKLDDRLRALEGHR